MVEWLLTPNFLSGADAGDIGEFNIFDICLIDELWTARNRAFHDHKAASCLLTAWDTQANSVVLQHVHREIYFGKLVLFVDATFKDLRATAGIIVFESEGSVLEAMAVNFDANQPLEAESWALFHAIRWCQTRSWRQVVIVSDCQLLVQGLQAGRAPDWRLTGVFWSMLELLDELPEVEPLVHTRPHEHERASHPIPNPPHQPPASSNRPHPRHGGRRPRDGIDDDLGSSSSLLQDR
ncbi:hypothetical protein G4B88_003889 [Cannabis sativa]|nr:hypothetical protein G4B88_003889 [Cannabis sativa]